MDYVGQHRAPETNWPEPTTDVPDVEMIFDMLDEGVCEATDGCEVEPDGVCQHGHPSWLLADGLI